MDSTNKNDQTVIELDRGYYFCGEHGNWHRLDSDIGRKHLIYFDEDKTNSQNAEYIYCGLNQCRRWHGAQKHFQYRWYIRLGSKHKLLVSPYWTDSSIQPNLPNETKENDLKNTSANFTAETLHGDAVLMNTEEIVKYSLSAIEDRKECLELTFDGGLGKGKKIEKWILTEMLVKMIELRNIEILNQIEGEHCYPVPKKKYREICDFWWSIDDVKHWLEVKTIGEQENIKKSIKQVRNDLDKRNRLKSSGIFHHLTIVIIKLSNIEDWRERINSVYKEYSMLHEADWCTEVDQNITLLYMLYHSPMNDDNV